MLCSQLDSQFKKKLQEALVLNPYCFKFRYPDDILLPEKGDVIQAIKHAKSILYFVKKKVQEKPSAVKRIW